MTFEDTRYDYGEPRFVTLGRLEGRTVGGCEKMGTVPSDDRISPIESANLGGAKWTVPDFFHAARREHTDYFDEKGQ